MSERALIGQKAQEFCDNLWQRGDFWDFESSEYERARCVRLLTILAGRRYARALEIGCGAGYFTRLLANIADHIVAFDIAPAAIARARTQGADLRHVEFRVANAMDYEWRADGPWDLIVCSDTIYYLGWLYSFFDVAWFAAELFAATRGGGRLLLANTMDAVEDKLLLPYLIRTYRDLFLNVGYRLETEGIFCGTKNGVDFEILISLFARAPEEGRCADTIAPKEVA
jgi:SAM-dependent methyltransferase